jgi:5-methylcytosine-specific restriction endonuclease McrA
MKKVYERDLWTCKECGKIGGELNAHHIKSFSLILVENQIKSLEDSYSCSELWEIDNGRTLCVACHKKTDSYKNKK